MKFNIINTEIFRQAKRFAVVGAASTIVNYVVFFYLLTLVNANYVLASIVGYFSGLLFGFLVNRFWTFTSVIKNRSKEFGLYVAVYSFSLLLNIIVLRIMVEIFLVNPLVGNLYAFVVAIISNFVGSKFLVFNKRAIGYFKKLLSYFTVPFLIILVIKVVASFFFASHYATQGFLPFLDYFSSTLHNPYDYFASMGKIGFPYPSAMLFIFGLPFIVAKQLLPVVLFGNIHVQLFLLRIPMLLADVLIYVVLCYLLPTKENKVLWLYFAAPIVLYLNYFHAQLDVLPTALLVLSLFFLFRRQEHLSFIALGIGLATKTHLFVAVPFYLIYLYRNRVGVQKLVELGMIALFAFIAFNPFLMSRGFFEAVFNNAEQQRLFNLFIPFGFKDLKLFIAPAALLLIFYKFASYKKLNKDSLILTLGLAFTILIALVPPTQGWFYWPLPLLVFFLVKFKNPPLLSFVALNGFFVLYFIFARDSDIFESLSPTFAAWASASPPSDILSRFGFNPVVLENILFTFLEVSLIAIAAWAYKVGISSNKLYQAAGKSFVIGIGGDSGVGKSTLADALSKVMGAHNFVRVDGDDVHKWERGHENWKVVTHLNPKGNHVHIDLEQALALLRGESVERSRYDHTTGTFARPAVVDTKKFIVFQGLMPFILEKMRELYHLKIYVEADEELRRSWKGDRDKNERGRTAEEILEQIERRRGDAGKFIHPQRSFADLVVSYKGDHAAHVHGMEYLLKNSVPIDDLVAALGECPALMIDQQYMDMNYQRIIFSGTITKDEIEVAAYKVFPNLVDIIENYPEFEDGFLGLHQLFVINFLSHRYKYQNDADE